MKQVSVGKQYCVDFLKVEKGKETLLSAEMLSREKTKKTQDLIEETLNKVSLGVM